MRRRCEQDKVRKEHKSPHPSRDVDVIAWFHDTVKNHIECHLTWLNQGTPARMGIHSPSHSRPELYYHKSCLVQCTKNWYSGHTAGHRLACKLPTSNKHRSINLSFKQLDYHIPSSWPSCYYYTNEWWVLNACWYSVVWLTQKTSEVEFFIRLIEGNVWLSRLSNLFSPNVNHQCPNLENNIHDKFVRWSEFPDSEKNAANRMLSLPLDSWQSTRF